MTRLSDERDRPRCPICRQPAAAPPVDGGRSPYPFCSDRCRLADLNRWLEGEYQIPTDDDDLDEATPDFDVPSR